MPHSLVKYAQTQKKTADGRQLFWGRAEQDGLPFRGIQPPVMPDEEYESRAVRVADVKNGIFDVTIPEQNAEYVRVLDACMNGWYKCLHVERFVNKEPKHYIEWAEFYMEDGAPMNMGMPSILPGAPK